MHVAHRMSWYARAPLLVMAALWAACRGDGSPPPAPPAATGQAVLAWGGNSDGQLGDGSAVQRLNPVTIALRDIKDVAAGGNYGLALTMDGRVLEWGGGTRAPAEVAGLTSVKAIAAGARQRLALREDGTVWAWGDNDRGQLGDGTNTTRPAPVQVVGLSNVLAIAAGARHSLAIASDFGVWSWGANDEGQLGDGTKTDRLTPVAVPGVRAIELAASATHTVALTTDMKVVGWGANGACQLGLDPRNAPSDPIICSARMQPTVLFEPPAYSISSMGGAIAAAANMTLVVLSQGAVYALGGHGDPNSNFYGMCSQDLALGPGLVQPLPPVQEVAAGAQHALFRTAAGEVWALGSNLAGQLGLGTTTVQECPTAIPTLRVQGASRLAAGAEHSLALIAGVISVDAPSLDFGPQLVGTSSAAPRVATLTNTGLAPLTLHAFGVAGHGDFAFTEDCPDRPAMLAAGAACRISVSFAPTATGPRSARITIAHDGLARQLEIALSGIGTQGQVTFSPPALNFGNQSVGASSAPITVTIRNSGTGDLLVSDIVATAGFSSRGDNCPRAPAPLAVQGTCTVDMTFTPTVLGAALGELRVTDAFGNVAALPLEGQGT
jgi:alpha-tubulin suppressor-like RCC1 family protein